MVYKNYILLKNKHEIVFINIIIQSNIITETL